MASQSQEKETNRKTGKEVAIPTGRSIITTDAPSYLTGKERTGAEALGKEDIKIPRIKLLQPLNPEVQSFQGKAIPGEFWHSVANVSLGSEFLFVPLTVRKRVVLWQPRHQGGGILAFSNDAVTWQSGANQTFKVKLKKGDKNEVEWKTGKNVQDSGLMEWGSSDPGEDNSPPAAMLSYEYLVYLPDHPNLSPCVMGVNRTGLPNARQFNSYLLMQRRPTASMAIRCFSDEETGDGNTWHVHAFEPLGFVNEETYKNVTSKLAEQYGEYQPEPELDNIVDTAGEIDDKVPY